MVLKMSKELAQMASQQEMIRKRMQEIRKLSGDQQAKKTIDKRNKWRKQKQISSI